MWVSSRDIKIRPIIGQDLYTMLTNCRLRQFPVIEVNPIRISDYMFLNFLPVQMWVDAGGRVSFFTVLICYDANGL